MACVRLRSFSQNLSNRPRENASPGNDGGEFLLLYFRTAIALVAVWFFASKAFAQPALSERDKLFCERWAALGLGIITIIACSVGMQFVQGEGVIVRSAKLLGSTVVWLLV
jgi:hypothetical protein